MKQFAWDYSLCGATNSAFCFEYVTYHPEENTVCERSKELFDWLPKMADTKKIDIEHCDKLGKRNRLAVTRGLLKISKHAVQNNTWREKISNKKTIIGQPSKLVHGSV